MDSKAVELLVAAMDRSQRFLMFQDRRDLLLTVWQFAVDQIGIEPDIDTLSIAILAFSKYQKLKYQQMASHLVSTLTTDDAMISEFKSGRKQIQCHQVLRALGNMGDLEGMWSFYTTISSDGDGARFALCR